MSGMIRSLSNCRVAYASFIVAGSRSGLTQDRRLIGVSGVI